MNEQIESIRLALSEGADDQARAAGIAACQQVMSRLAAPMMSGTVGPPVSQGPNLTQLLDYAIERLKTEVVDANVEVEEVEQVLRIPFVPMPRRRNGR